MHNSKKIISSDQLRTGDLILSMREGPVAENVSSITNSKYTHAAICYDNEFIAEVAGHASKTPKADFIQQSPYHAVFRLLGAWPECQASRLRDFVDTLIANGGSYDRRGFRSFVDRKDQYIESIPEKVWQYFTGASTSDPTAKTKFFCSEFVAACFIVSGFLLPSAAVIFQPDTYSPGDLGRDAAFGFFVGYVTKSPEIEVPDDDEFTNRVLYTDILLSQYSTKNIG